MSLSFRPLQLGDAEMLDAAQLIMGRENYAFAFDYEPRQNFAAYLDLLEDRRHGQNLRPGSVPSIFEIGLLEDRIVARLSVRLTLNEFLLQQGGHLGYGVLPGFRGRGIGAACLRRGLAITSSQGIARTLVTCDEDNPISRHLIECAGGRYESSYTGPDVTVPVRRYWFATPL
jgi:predicted acetyltransferase